MGHNGILSIYDLGIISALVEHSHIHAKHVGKIHGPVHGAFIRADDHQMILVHSQIGHLAEQRLHELVKGIEAVKAI